MSFGATTLDRAMRDIAIIDDDANQALVTSEIVRHAGFNPVVLDGPFKKVTKLVTAVTERAQAAVCDHRLRYGGFADFTGAEATAKLVSAGVPAILVTQFAEQDYEVSIRQWRDKLPIVLRRAEADAQRITQALMQCQAEIQGKHAPDRQPHRIIFEVVDKSAVAGEDVFDVIIPEWDADSAVRLPARLIPYRLRRKTRIGTLLIADVNIEATRSSDLFFENFEPAPQPDPNDGLA
jgi:CheY-like chemotaxis protein